MSDRIHEALRAGFPDGDVETVDVRNARPGNETALVTFGDGARTYLKTAVDDRRRLVRETAALRYAGGHCAVETPTVVRADPRCERPYLATEPLPGTPMTAAWRDADADRARLARIVGRVVAGVHTAAFDAPGRITGGGADALELTDETWPEALCATVEERADDWFASRFDDLPGRLVEVIREAASLLEGAPSALLHGDASRPNCHVDPAGVIDWERALVGDPGFDLTDAVGHVVDQPDVGDDERDELRDALYDGYRERAGSLPAGLGRRRPVYRAVAYLVVPQTFEEWAPVVDEPRDELADAVRTEFEARLSSAREAAGTN